MTSISDTSFYNKASSEKLGWEPEWFGAKGFGKSLEEAVKSFQKEYGLKQDGLVGPMTYARIYTQVEADRHQTQNKIIICGKEVDIDWEKVDNTLYKLPKDNYKHHFDKRNPVQIVTHWDATTSAKSCFNILSKRGISTHFVIDNDGAIYQMVDVNDIAWHAGGFNKNSIGIDLSNAFYLKHNKTYEKMGFEPRPVITSNIHGRDLGEHLGYYPAQLKAYKELLKVLCSEFEIELNVPLDNEGNLLLKELPEDEKKDFKGLLCHYHLSSNKIDCAGLELDKIVNEIKKETRND